MVVNSVKVFNKNIYDYETKFKGVEYKIKAGGFIEMNPTEAEEFVSQFKAPIVLKGGVHDPRGYQMLEIRKDDKIEVENKPSQDSFICQKCGFVAKSSAGLRAHIRANHLDELDEDARRDLISEV
jgi:hypothetical protein